MKYRIIAPILLLMVLGLLFWVTHNPTIDTQQSVPTKTTAEGIHF